MKIENRTRVLEVFDDAISIAASISIKNAEPIKKSKTATYIGTTLVEKNSDGLYDVNAINNTISYKNISVFDVALIIAQRYSSGDFNTIKKVMILEHMYNKHHTDMIHYLHCFRTAKKRNDVERMCILEDKFQVAEAIAKKTKDKIASFKKLKSVS